MNIIVEIRAAEGGQDAKELAETLYGAYLKRCSKLGL